MVTTSLAEAVSWIEDARYRSGDGVDGPKGEWFANKGVCRRGGSRGNPELAANPIVCGFTTNPTLMRKAGSKTTRGSPGRFSITSRTDPSHSKCAADDFDEMRRQAHRLSFGDQMSTSRFR